MQLSGSRSPFPEMAVQLLLPMFHLTTLDFGQSPVVKPLVSLPNGDEFFTGENEGEEWWLEGPGLVLGQTWLRPRMSELVKTYRDAKIPNEDIRLAQGVFRLGSNYLVYLTVRLERLGEEMFTPTYCVAKLAEIVRDEMAK